MSKANIILNKYISKPKVIWKVFHLKSSDRKLRLYFYEFMREHNLSSKDRFLQMEIFFPLCSYMNRWTSIIRLYKKTENKSRR